MHPRALTITLLLLTLTIAPLLGEHKPFSLDLEAQYVWNPSNRIAIPGDSGTRFSLPDVLEVQPRAAYRLRLGWQMAPRHQLSILLAPLTLRGEGVLATPLSFNGQDYTPGADLKALYRFDSYRLTWAYTWIQTARTEFKIGFTAKIRSAEIALTKEGRTNAYTNVGFVPLLHAALRWRFASRILLLANLDALAAKQGRAEDLYLGLGWQPRPDLTLKLGYRTVEGGADNDKVYTFAWLHYLTAGLQYTF